MVIVQTALYRSKLTLLYVSTSGTPSLIHTMTSQSAQLRAGVIGVLIDQTKFGTSWALIDQTGVMDSSLPPHYTVESLVSPTRYLDLRYSNPCISS